MNFNCSEGKWKQLVFDYTVSSELSTQLLEQIITGERLNPTLAKRALQLHLLVHQRSLDILYDNHVSSSNEGDAETARCNTNRLFDKINGEAVTIVNQSIAEWQNEAPSLPCEDNSQTDTPLGNSDGGVVSSQEVAAAVVQNLVTNEALSLVDSTVDLSVTTPSSNDAVAKRHPVPNMSDLSLRIENHCQSLKAHNSNFLEVLESRSIAAEPSTNDIHHLILGRCNISTVFNLAISLVCKGELMLDEIDTLNRIVWLALEGKMAVVSHAKKKKIASITDKLVNTHSDDGSISLSTILQTFVSDDGGTSSAERKEDNHPLAMAARRATNEHEGNFKWERHAVFCQQVQNSLGNLALITAGARVLSMFTFDSFANILDENDKNTLESYLPLCEHICTDDEEFALIGTQSLAWFYDSIIFPATRDTTHHSLDVQMQAFKLSEFIRAKLASKVAIGAFEIVEAVPGNVLFQTCSEEERKEYKDKNDSAYLVVRDTQGKVTRTSQKRRRLCVDLIFRAHCAGKLTQILTQHNYSEEARVLSFGCLCMPPFGFSRHNGHSLLMDIRIYQDDQNQDKFIQSILDGPLAYVSKKLDKAIDVYENDTVFADVTKDLQDGTKNTYNLFSSLFELVANGNETVCNILDDSDDSDEEQVLESSDNSTLDGDSMQST